MKITLNIEDHLPQDEIKAIVVDHVRSIVAKGGERLISNLAYSSAESILDGALTKDEMAQIRVRAKAVIEELSAFVVFRKKDAWGGEESVAYKELQKAMEEHKHLISERVKSAILAHDFEKSLRSNDEYFIEVMGEMMRRAFGGVAS